MKLIEQFDRLDKLIVDRSTDIAQMRNIIHLIREQVEAYEIEAELHKEREKKISELESANLKLKTEIERRDSDDSTGHAGRGGIIDRLGS
jgi:hypothetical protein